MSDLRAADERARERALDVTGSFIVQAPAGSGKTELLTRRFLALLATVSEPESVLAITFTRKAAAEMRDRIVRALRAASEPGEDAARLHRRTLELARTALATDRRQRWDLLGNPGRLRIQTIDSLNLGLARRLPVLSGLGAGLGVEEQGRELYREAAERLLVHLPEGEPLHSRAVTTLLEHVDNRVPRFVALVVEMLLRRESWLPLLPSIADDPASLAALRASLEDARGGLIRTHLAALRSAFPDYLLRKAVEVAREAAAVLVASGSDSPIAAWAGHVGLPGEAPDHAPLWLGLATLLLKKEGTPRQRFDYKLGIPPGPTGQPLRTRAANVTSDLECHAEAIRRLHEVRSLPPRHYDAREWQVLQAQLVVVRLAVAELELEFARRRSADYARFAAAARQALGTDEAPTDTALALDSTLRHVLVDEFQDTSEAQVTLLERLTAGWQPRDGRTLFLVGDPMQSVYRFRNAEVGLFLEVRDRGLGALDLEPLTLAVNFRSTQPVVEWLNESFERVLPPRDDVLRGAVSYSPSACAPKAGADGGVVVHALFRRSRMFEAASVADIVERRLADDPVARIAILVQSRSHLVDIVAELARRSVPYQATDIDPLGERPIVLDLLALTRALAHAADRPAWLAVLRAPWCGLELADLHLLAGDDLEATVPELLCDPVRRGRLEPESSARLERAWNVLRQAATELRRFGLRDAVERAWLALGGPATAESERALDEAQSYLDELAELERRASGPVDLARLAEVLQDLYAPSRPRPGIRVELLTIHKAKGLQFDTVIVPGLDRRPRGDAPRLLHWARIHASGRHELVIAPAAGAGADPNPLYAWLADLETEKLLQERRRLLYVAATRAERWLHLFGSCRLKAGDGPAELVSPSATVALGMLWPTVEPEFRRRLAELGSIEGETPPDIVREPPLRRLPAGWRLPGIVVPRIDTTSSQRAAPAASLEFDWATETARHVGTVVHRELQRLARGGSVEATFGERTRRRHYAELAELGVPAERRAAAAERVMAALQRTLADARGRWLLDPHHAAAENELALTGRIGGELASVVIDRTFVDADGTRWIVDYKTSSHEGADLEHFLASEQERYRPQLERYAELVRRLGPEPVRLGLYFPLLSAWREWRWS